MPRRLTVAEAADALGITETAVRQRIGRATLPTERADGRVYVLLPDAPDGDTPVHPDLSADDGDTPPESPADMPALAALADAFTRALEAERARADAERERASKAEQAASMWQERAANLHAELERALALPAHEPERPPWWRRWRRS